MEKIKDIEITNFKSIKHLKIDGCNKINVFIGMPNAGKSNILEALGLFGKINNTVQNPSPSLNHFIRFKSSSELFFEENILKEINFKVNSVTICVLLHEELKYGFTGYKLDNNFSYSNTNSKHPLENNKNIIELCEIKKYQFNGIKFRESENKTVLNYPNGENLVQIISSNQKLRKIVNQLFNDNNLKLLIEKNTNELKIFKEYQDGTVFTLPYELIADTLQRLIFYQAAIMSNQGSTLLFEEPEAHCFEPYILEFTNSVKYDENDNQFFIVTHSDFIIQEFLRDEESKEKTNIYLVNNVDGETKVKLLDQKNNDDVYEFGMNPFFNFENLWDNN